jgi:hypothetical protein
VSDGRTNIQETPREAGLMLTVTVKAYDSGMIELDGRPISQRHHDEYDTVQGWTDTAEYLIHKLNELRRQAAARRGAGGELPGADLAWRAGCEVPAAGVSAWRWRGSHGPFHMTGL